MSNKVNEMKVINVICECQLKDRDDKRSIVEKQYTFDNFVRIPMIDEEIVISYGDERIIATISNITHCPDENSILIFADEIDTNLQIDDKTN